MAAPRETEKSKLLADSAGASGAIEREMEQRSLLAGEETARAKFDDPSFLTSFDDGRRVKSPSVSGGAGSSHNASSFAAVPATSTLGSDVGNKWAGLTWVLGLSITAAVLGSSTQFGFNTGVINNPKQAIQSSFDNKTHSFSDTEMTVAVAIFAIGGMLGALPAGLIADKLGRKYTLLGNNVLIVVGVALQSLAIHPIMFIAGRFVIGIGVGVSTVVVPLYLSEISPLNLRGSIGVCHQVAIVSTILLSQILGLDTVFGRPDEEFFAWRILFAFPLLFTVFQLLLFPWLPESPKYLFIKRKQEEKAVEALKQLRGHMADITQEVKLMQDEREEMERPRERVSLLQLITVPHLRQAITVSIVLHLTQQLGGINGILYYSNDVFRAAGIPHPDVATVGTVGVVLVLITFVVVVLIEHLGRRTLMIYGLAGMTIFFTFFTSMFCFQYGFYGKTDDDNTSVTVPGVLLVISSLGIVILFGLGPGVIPWVMVAEFFNQETRPMAISIATLVNWLANFTVGLVFPFILKGLFPYGTVIFVITCSVFWVYLYFFLPETKGKTIEETTATFKQATTTSCMGILRSRTQHTNTHTGALQS